MEDVSETSQVLISVGAEGGGATLLRKRAEDGRWHFVESTNAMNIGDDGVDFWEGETRTMPSVDAWLAKHARVLPYLYPIFVHRSLRKTVLRYVLAMARARGERGGATGNLGRWREICSFRGRWSERGYDRPHLIFVVASSSARRRALRELLRTWDEHEQRHGEHAVVAVEEPEEMLVVERELRRAPDVVITDLTTAATKDLRRLHLDGEGHTDFIALAASRGAAKRLEGRAFATFGRPSVATPEAYRRATPLSGVETLLKAVESAIYARG
jgi:hypothetical protein